MSKECIHFLGHSVFMYLLDNCFNRHWCTVQIWRFQEISAFNYFVLRFSELHKNSISNHYEHLPPQHQACCVYTKWHTVISVHT